jgi:predicted Fe-Mo cluster-binding NifX family protein
LWVGVLYLNKDGGNIVKIAVSAQGVGLKDPVDPRFGRCQHFVVYDSDTGNVTAMANTSGESSGGAGVQTAQNLVNQAVGAVLVGNVGPNAFKVLNAAGIKVYGGITGNVENSLALFKENKLNLMSDPNVSSHAGMRR